jgi:hypothetical protein
VTLIEQMRQTPQLVQLFIGVCGALIGGTSVFLLMATYMEILRNKLEYTEQMLKLEQRFRQEDKEILDQEIAHGKASDKMLFDLLKEQGVPQDRGDALH